MNPTSESKKEVAESLAHDLFFLNYATIMVGRQMFDVMCAELS
jgi:hypothetical protein